MEIQSSIEQALGEVFIDPAIGWAVNGRGNYTCPECLCAH